MKKRPSKKIGKKKKFKVGKIKRHRLRVSTLNNKGFGKTITTPTVVFRVEMSWLGEDEEEENFQVHWISCRKFVGTEREDLFTHYRSLESADWNRGETLESKFVCVYVSKFLAENKHTWHLNQAFVFPTPKEGNETIREPIYIIRCSKDLSKDLKGNAGLDVVLNNSIDHKYNGNIITCNWLDK